MCAFVFLVAAVCVSAHLLTTTRHTPLLRARRLSQPTVVCVHGPEQSSKELGNAGAIPSASGLAAAPIVCAAMMLAFLTSAPAMATAPDAIPSTVATYAHFLGFLIAFGALMTERMLIRRT